MLFNFFLNKVKIVIHVYKKKGLKGIWYYSIKHIRVWLCSPIFLILSIFSINPKDRFLDLISFTTDFYRTRDLRKILKIMRSKGEALGIEDIDISKFKKSDKIFLLASGSTVNDLHDSDWGHIAKHNSIGFNYWLIHDFVPTYYFFEAFGEINRLHTHSQDNNIPFQIWLKWLKKKINLYKDVPFICDYKMWYDLIEDFDNLPKEIRRNLYLYIPYTLKISSPGLMKLILLFCLYMDYFRLFNYNMLIKHRGSINALITFSILAGYKEIILIGIDLNSKDYFWEVSPEKYNSCPLPDKTVQTKNHPTYDKIMCKYFYRTLTVDVFIDLFERFILRPYGVKLYIGSKKSALYPRLPLYPGFKENQNITDKTNYIE